MALLPETIAGPLRIGAEATTRKVLFAEPLLFAAHYATIADLIPWTEKIDALLTQVRDWLKPDGRAFIHVFTHRTTPYRFDVDDESDWIGQHFFSGGVMPSHGLMAQFPDLFEVEADWRWSGRHYERTALDWLANFDRNDAAIRGVLREVYGDAAPLWRRRWRLFFLATAGLFGHRGGEEWGVSHYRLKPVR